MAFIATAAIVGGSIAVAGGVAKLGMSLAGRRKRIQEQTEANQELQEQFRPNDTGGEDDGMICAACQNDTLVQKYPNCIECPSCHSKWYNNALGNHNFGKSLRKTYASKYKAGRS